LGEIFYFDMGYLGWDGKAKTCKGAVCMHEEDASIQWKHTDMRTRVSEVRRARRLVVSSISTVGNYDYGWYYHFHLDGEIEVEVKLTGILSVGGSEGANPEFSKIVAPGIAAPLHQHLFCFRFDWNLDDGPNSLCEEQVELLPKNENPTGNVFRHVSRLLQTEADAMRNIAPDVNRSWKIMNRGKMNGLGKPVAYKVLQGAAPRLLAHDDAVVARRAAFAKYNLWATPYTDGELYCAGEHTTMSDGGAGLPSYTKTNRSIVDCDLVTWHTIGATHIPRPEDWPIMPVEKARLNLVPVGFFDKSPVMNLPPGNGANICQSKL
jgi:primary-amine oxidase